MLYLGRRWATEALSAMNVVRLRHTYSTSHSVAGTIEFVHSNSNILPIIFVVGRWSFNQYIGPKPTDSQVSDSLADLLADIVDRCEIQDV